MLFLAVALLGKTANKKGTLERKPRARNPHKLPLDQFVFQPSDAYLKEITEALDCSISSVWLALNHILIT